LEDNPRDAKLTASVLDDGEGKVQYEVTDSPEFFRQSLEKAKYDVILADFNLHNWTAMDALEILKHSGKDVPLIVVTGSLGDEAAVECIKQGAADIVLKDRPARLPTAVRRALEERRLREQHKQAEESLRESEERYRALFERNLAGVFQTTLEGRILECNLAMANILGFNSPQDVWNRHVQDFYYSEEDRTNFLEKLQIEGHLTNFEMRLRRHDGGPVWLLGNLSLMAPAASGIQTIDGTLIDITERKLADAESSRLAAIVNSTDNAILSTTREGLIATWNAGAERMYGYTAEEMKGKHFSIFIPEDRRGDLAANEERLLRGQALVHSELENIRKDGSRFPVSLTISPIKDVAGFVTGVSVIAHDITEGKRVEKELRLTQFSMEHASDGMFWMDSQGRIIRVNEAACRSLGRSREELLSLSIPDIDPLFRKEAWEAFWEELKSRGTMAFETQHQTKQGRIFTVAITANRVEFDGKEYSFALVHDITERKRADESLRESEERFRATFENAGIGMALVDMQGRPIKSNPRLRQMLGYSEEELSRMVFTEFTHPDDRELDWGLYSELVTGKYEKYEIEKRFLNKGGGMVWGLLTASLVKDSDRRPVCAVAMVQDITERKRTERELRLTQFSVKHASEAIFWIDPQGLIVYVNEAACRSLGRSREELLSLSIPDLDPLTPKEAWGRFWEEIKARGSMTFETQNETKLGRIFPVEISANYLEFDGKEYAFAFNHDITERKRAEEELLFKTALLEAQAETTIDGILVVDMTDHILLVNSQFSKMWNSAEEAIHTKDDRKLREYVQAQVKDPATFIERVRYLNAHETEKSRDELELKNGRVFDRYSSPLRDSTGKLYGRIWYFRDITERKKSEAEHIRLVTAIEQSAEAVVITNTDGVIEYVNPAFTWITGYGREEALGQNLRILKSGKQDRAFYQQLWATILKGEIWHGEIINRRKDGKLYTEEVNITPIREARGEITHFIAAKQDVTERRSMEEQLHHAAKMEAVGRLAGGVAHDFNNLLTIINGYTELLLETPASEIKPGAFLKEIKDAGERAASLTRQLLAFSRRQVLAPRALDLNGVVSNVEKMLRRLIGEDVELRTVLDPSLGRIKADPGQIEQVIMNLAVNARDAMPSGGILTIETSNVELDQTFARSHVGVKPGPHVMLKVGDTGVGMTVETKARIFEPFFTTKEKGKGTGLGLATVYGIVQQSEGVIWVDSELGQGTVFKISLPAVSEIPAPEGHAKTETAAASGSETILVVEDEEGVRSLVCAALESVGYKVLETDGAASALATCAKYDGPIHLLLTDVVMPQLSGPLVAEKLTSLRPDIKVLYMSGYTDDAVVRHGVLSHDMPFIQKPFTPMALRRKIREVLGGK
jgi:PAS domain S-box-containing protein